jgi:hypothetical protein
VITGADKVNDFFFLNEEQEEAEFGANSNSKRAAELFNAKSKKGLDEKVSIFILECYLEIAEVQTSYGL